MKKILSVIALAILLPSCHHMFSQDVKINPVLNQLSTNNSSKSYSLNVTDKRENKGAIGSRWQIFGGDIYVSRNLTTIVEDKFNNSLIKSGFRKGNDSKIEIKISNLEYGTRMNLFSVGYNCSFAINVKVMDKNNNLKFSEIFSKKEEKISVILPFASTNEEFINSVISRVLNNVLADEKFIEALSK